MDRKIFTNPSLCSLFVHQGEFQIYKMVILPEINYLQNNITYIYKQFALLWTLKVRKGHCKTYHCYGQFMFAIFSWILIRQSINMWHFIYKHVLSILNDCFYKHIILLIFSILLINFQYTFPFQKINLRGGEQYCVWKINYSIPQRET